eukprot:Em0004g1450a
MEASLPCIAEDWGFELHSGHARLLEVGTRTFHVNMLKRWNTAKDRAYFSAGGMEEEVEEEDNPEWRGGEVGESRMGKQLTVAQLQQLQGLLHEFQDVMNSAPGRTTMAEHNVRPTDSKPAPYRLPHAYPN